jgi:diaminopimelate decarboxylase
VGSFLRHNEIQLWLEPGRALLDQTGLTLARVNAIKGQRENIVGLEMKRQDIAFLDQEIFVDPIFEPADYRSNRGGHEGYYLAGNLCLENDLIFRRKVFLPSPPRKGDLFAFINTTAYMMDFSATNSIMQPKARKVAVVNSDDGMNNLTWMLDEEYSPVWKLH